MVVDASAKARFKQAVTVHAGVDASVNARDTSMDTSVHAGVNAAINAAVDAVGIVVAAAHSGPWAFVG